MIDTLAHLKEWIKHALGISDALIHVNVGLGLFLALTVLLRKRSGGVLVALAVVVVLQFLNEILDASIEIGRRDRINFGEAFRDTVATLFWPAVLMFVWRFLCARGDSRRNASDPDRPA